MQRGNLGKHICSIGKMKIKINIFFNDIQPARTAFDHVGYYANVVDWLFD